MIQYLAQVTGGVGAPTLEIKFDALNDDRAKEWLHDRVEYFGANYRYYNVHLYRGVTPIVWYTLEHTHTLKLVETRK